MGSKIVIPFYGINRQYLNIKDELLHEIDRVYSSGQVLDGEYTYKFEHRMATRCDRKYAVAVNSGTQALIFAQQALLSRNRTSKILIPTISFVATLNSVLIANNVPVFCDVDADGQLDVNKFDSALGPSLISAIMYVNLFGNVVDNDKLILISKFFNDQIPLIEDAAQSFGAYFKGRPSGSLGDISILSFDPTKNLNNYGSGGMVLTDRPEIYEFLTDIRDNGKTSAHENPGTNSKMSESDCAQMLVKLKYFDFWQQRRTKIANYYNQEFSNLLQFGLCLPSVADNVVHAWHKYVIRTGSRRGLANYLSNVGIETKFHYTTPLYEVGAGWPFVNYAKDLYMEASSFCKECISLPLYPELTDSEVQQIVDSVKKYYCMK